MLLGQPRQKEHKLTKGRRKKKASLIEVINNCDQYANSINIEQILMQAMQYLWLRRSWLDRDSRSDPRYSPHLLFCLSSASSLNPRKLLGRRKRHLKQENAVEKKRAKEAEY